MMVSYRYNPADVDKNHDGFMNGYNIAVARKGAAPHRLRSCHASRSVASRGFVDESGRSTRTWTVGEVVHAERDSATTPFFLMSISLRLAERYS
jgi:hypothetical protein